MKWVKYSKVLKKFIASVLMCFALLRFGPPSNEKPALETYRLFETNVRQNILKFYKIGLYISAQCVYKQGKSYQKRNCNAWKPLDEIESGDYRKYFGAHKVLPDFARTRSVSIYLCIQSGGFITTEVNEYGKYGRDVEPMDFCQFDDKSLVGLKSMDRALLTAPKIDMKIFEKNTKP
jgi:hypothetical protein